MPNAVQPRTLFDADDLAELVHSVREFGVLQPIVVRPHPDWSASTSSSWVSGASRATKEAGLDTIPAVIRDTADDDMLRDALLENLHRSQLNPLEEASAYQQLLSDFGITQEELANRHRPVAPADQQHDPPAQAPLPRAACASPPACSRPVMPAPSSRSRSPRPCSSLADKIVNEDLSVRAAEAAATRLRSPRPR